MTSAEGSRSAVPLDLRIVESVAGAEGCEPHELDETLYRVVDPDALTNLFRGTSGESAGELMFDFCGYEVTVTADGEVELSRESTHRIA